MLPTAPFRRFSMGWPHFALATAVTLLSAPLRAEVTESVEYRHYTVEPRWYQSLAGSVLKASPVREGGKTFMGNTEWTVRWDLEWRTLNGGLCAVIAVHTHLHALITLPQATLEDEADRKRFDTFLTALRLHELGHVDITREAAEAIDTRILQLPPMASCAELEAQANELGHGFLEQARQRGAQFDVDTGHGKTQGAVLN